MYKLLTLIFIFMGLCGNAQTSKQELLNEIDETIAAGETAIKIGKLETSPIRMYAGGSQNPKPVKLPPSSPNIQAFKDSLNNLEWAQVLIGSGIKVEIEESNLRNYLEDQSIEIQSFAVKNISLYDGTLKDTVVDRVWGNSLDFELNTNLRTIKSMELQLFYQAPSYTPYPILLHQNEIPEIGLSEIKKNGKSISYQVSSKHKKDIEVYALNDNGEYYTSTSSSMFTKLSPEAIGDMKKYVEVLRKARKKVESNRIKSIESLQKYMEDRATLSALNQEASKIYEADFPIVPAQLLFVSQNKPETHTTTLKLNYNGQEKLFIARGEGFNDYFLVDPYGKEIPETRYAYISKNPHWDNYYNADEKTLWVDPETHNVETFDFTLNSDNRIVEKWFAQPEDKNFRRKGEGLFDPKTRTLLIPVKQSQFFERHPYLIVMKKANDVGEGETALLTEEGKVLIPMAQQDFTFSIRGVFALKKDEKSVLYTYDNQKKSIKKRTTRDYSYFNMLWYSANDEKYKEELLIKANKNAAMPSDYLDYNGEIVIDGTQFDKISSTTDAYIVKYKNQQYALLNKYGKRIKKLPAFIKPKHEISAGMLQALHIDKNRYGYLNTHGEVVIPFTYYTATRFIMSKKYKKPIARVSTIDSEGNRKHFAIDKEGQIVGEVETSLPSDRRVKETRIQPPRDAIKTNP